MVTKLFEKFWYFERAQSISVYVEHWIYGRGFEVLLKFDVVNPFILMLKIQLKNADALASKNCRNGNAKKNNVEIGNHGNINTEMQ